jgi:seryl-tRNA synthetase
MEAVQWQNPDHVDREIQRRSPGENKLLDDNRRLGVEVGRLKKENERLQIRVAELEAELKRQKSDIEASHPCGEDLFRQCDEIDANLARLCAAFQRRMDLFADCAKLCGAVASEIGGFDAFLGPAAQHGE